MTEEEKLRTIQNLYWEYNVSSSDVLEIIKGSKIVSSEERNRIFVRCFEHLPWQNVVWLWGIDECRKMGTPEIRRLIRPQLRGKYDFIYGILQGKPVSVPRQDIEIRRKLVAPILSDRWNRTKQVLFQA
ncbi:MAG: hypothetical protein ACOX0D_01335 [Sphaerochaeta sp.]|jgi:hypothetical protein